MMNRREFLKLIAVGSSPLVASMMCNLPFAQMILTPTSTPTTNPAAYPTSTSLPIQPSPGATSPAKPVIQTPTVAPTTNDGAVPPPPQGLASNFNYHLHSNCSPITGLSVAIEITKDIVSDIGFSFQLNGYSPQGANCTWQQYIFELAAGASSPFVLWGFIDNWPSEKFAQALGLSGKNIINHHEEMLTLPSGTVVAGTRFVIDLKYDQNQNVNGVTFTFTDKQGKTTEKQIMLETLTYAAPNRQPVTIEGLSPIHAFELNLVGPIDAKSAYLTSGAGSITYTASSPLLVANQDPQCTAARSERTAEQANAVYAPLNAGPSKKITQTFEVKIPPPYHSGNRFALVQPANENQINLFMIDNAGQLEIFSVTGNGRWQMSKPLGTGGMGHPDSALGVSPRAGVAGQYDLFLADQNGQLIVFSAGGDGIWTGPKPIGDSHTYHFGTGVAITPHLGVNNRTDAFLVDKQGNLNLFWVVGSGNWNGPQQIGPGEMAHKDGSVPLVASKHFGVENQTDLFIVDTNGQLNVFSSVGAGNWRGPQKIGPSGLTHPMAMLAVSPRFGKNNQTDIYVVDTNGQLNVFSALGSQNWSGPQKIGPAGLTTSGAAVAVGQKPGTTDQTQVYLIDNNGQLNVFTGGAGSQWSDPVLVGSQNVAPAGAPLQVCQKPGAGSQTDLFVVNQTGDQSVAFEQAGWPVVFWSTDGEKWNGPKELVHDI